jgi:hypothetical protein
MLEKIGISAAVTAVGIGIYHWATKDSRQKAAEALTDAINDSKATLDVLESRIAEVKKLATPAGEKKEEKKAS